MADNQETSNDDSGIADYGTNDGNDENNPNDIIDTIESTTILPSSPSIDDDGTNVDTDDYSDDEPLPDVTVKLYIDAEPEGDLLPNDVVNAGITDIYGNIITTTTPWNDVVNDYTNAITQGIYDEINGNGTDVTGKRWWGSWTWSKALIVGLIALCIIGIILALIFFITGKKFNKSNGNQPATKSKKGEVAKSVSPNPEYSPVPTNV